MMTASGSGVVLAVVTVVVVAIVVVAVEYDVPEEIT
jgi:hypothetical protein